MAQYHWTLEQLIRHKVLDSILIDLFYSAYYSITNNFGFLLLILIGALAARRHGRLALLLPLGYLIPTVVLGRFDYDPRMPYLLIGASAAVLIYRVFVSLIAPLWIVRSASDRAKKLAGTIGLITAVGIIAAANIILMIAMGAALDSQLNWTDIYYTGSPQLITLAGFALAISLYRPERSTQPGLQPEPVVMET